MDFSNWLIKWKILLLLTLRLLYVESQSARHRHNDMWHFYKMKKFITAVAFARALGKRQRILPVPIPIPIPIAQNEIIKLPLNTGGKTMVIGANGHEVKQTTGLNHILGSISSHGTGSTSYGYAQPSSGNINLQSLTSSDSNVVSLSSLLGNNANNNSPKIIIVGGQSGSMNQAPSVIHLNGLNGLQNGNLQTGFNLGNGIGDLDSAYSNHFPGLHKFPPNLYSDFHQKRMPPRFGGRRRKNPHEMEFLRGSGLNYYSTSEENIHRNYGKEVENYRSIENFPQNSINNNKRRPIPVGEKFDPIP